MKVGDEWVGWFCVERPEVVFEDVITLPLTHRRGKGCASIEVENEHVLSCEPGSLRIVSVLADRPALIEHKLAGAEVSIVCHAVGGLALPTKVTVRIEGIRLGFAGERWPRFTETEAESNNLFWGSALEVKVA